MAAVPLCASLVAVMVAGPTVAPLTSPLPLTVATAVLLDAQVTVRPVSVLPFASLRVAVSWNVRPVGTVADAGVTVTDATGAGGVLDEIVKLHSVCVPDSVCNAQLSSADTGGWSVRNAKPVPIVSSALPAGVT